MMTTEYTMAVEWQCRDIHAWVECDLDKIDPQKNEKKFLCRRKNLLLIRRGPTMISRLDR